MTDTKYNGWTNYETWNWKLWLDNDYGTYEYYQEVIQEVIATTEPEFDWQTLEDARIYALVTILESDCENMRDELPEQIGPFCDILGAGINRINWYEIAQNMLSDIDVGCVA